VCLDDDRDFLESWRKELLARCWAALARDEEKGGQPQSFPLGIMQFPAMDRGACNAGSAGRIEPERDVIPVGARGRKIRALAFDECGKVRVTLRLAHDNHVPEVSAFIEYLRSHFEIHRFSDLVKSRIVLSRS